MSLITRTISITLFVNFNELYWLNNCRNYIRVDQNDLPILIYKLGMINLYTNLNSFKMYHKQKEN